MLENQKLLLEQENSSLKDQTQYYQKELDQVVSLKNKELKDKSLELQSVKKLLQEKNDELSKIEAELIKVPKEDKDPQSAGSLWKYVDQLNKQLEEKGST